MSILGRFNIGTSTQKAIWTICIAWLIGTGWVACAVSELAKAVSRR